MKSKTINGPELQIGSGPNTPVKNSPVKSNAAKSGGKRAPAKRGAIETPMKTTPMKSNSRSVGKSDLAKHGALEGCAMQDDEMCDDHGGARDDKGRRGRKSDEGISYKDGLWREAERASSKEAFLKCLKLLKADQLYSWADPRCRKRCCALCPVQFPKERVWVDLRASRYCQGCDLEFCQYHFRKHEHKCW